MKMNEDNPLDLPRGLTNLNIAENIAEKKQIMLDKDNDDILSEFPIELPRRTNTKGIQAKPKQPMKSSLKNPLEESQEIRKLVKKRKLRLFRKKEQKPNVPKPIKLSEPKVPEPEVPEPKIPKAKGKKFNVWIPLTIILALIIIVALFITISCDCPEVSSGVMDLNSAETLAISIKDQIISQGYAEVIVGDITLKLAPYTG